MNDYTDSDCTDSNCPVHFRNDAKGEGEFGFPYLISYAGEYAVFSDVAVKQVSDEKRGSLMLDIVSLLFTGAPKEEVDRIVAESTEAFTYTYKVGDGSLGSTPEPEEKFYGEPGDVETQHAMALEMVKMRQSLI